MKHEFFCEKLENFSLTLKYSENRWKIWIRGHHWLWGMDAPGRRKTVKYSE